MVEPVDALNSSKVFTILIVLRYTLTLSSSADVELTRYFCERCIPQVDSVKRGQCVKDGFLWNIAG